MVSSNIYMQNIMDHYHSPENFGVLDDPTRHVVEVNKLCGDKIELFLDLDLKEGIVEDVKFQGEGCAISQAAMSILSAEIKGKKIEEVKRLRREDVVEMLGIELSPTRLKCALLSLQAVLNALE